MERVVRRERMVVREIRVGGGSVMVGVVCG